MRMVPVGSQAMQAKGELSGTVSYKPQSKSQKPKAISQRTQDNNRMLCGPRTRSMEQGLMMGPCFKVCR